MFEDRFYYESQVEEAFGSGIFDKIHDFLLLNFQLEFQLVDQE